MRTPRRPAASAAPSKKLLALTAAAMSLPGYAPPVQGWAELESTASYRFSLYSESDLPASATNGLDGQRYQVLSHQFHLLRPARDDRDYSVDATVETMSGASPWFIVPGGDGKPIQIMSGATIDDVRAAVEGRVRQYGDDDTQTYSLGVSKERDYLSLGGSADWAWDLNEKNTTLNAGLQYSHDLIDPTDGGSARFPNRIRSADKDSATLTAGLSQILNRDTTAQLNLSYTFSAGYLSDPYKQVYVAGNILPDARPDRRNQFALTARLRQYWARFRAALRLDGTLFRDDWGVASESLELGWFQNVWDDWTVTPSIRWYEQKQADFHSPFFTATSADGHYSSDYRLSTFGALSYRMGVQREGPQWSFALSAERYDADAAYSLRSVNQANPGLVTFTIFSAGLSYKF